MTLDDLVGKSIYIIREAKARFRNPAVLWSTGKDSTTLLSLVREALYEIPFPVIFIDTSFQFKETYEFRDRIAREWNLNLIICRNKEAIDRGISPFYYDKFTCCHQLKTEALKKLVQEYKFDALLLSIRRDEHYMRNIERYLSPRNRDWEYRIVEERTEADIEGHDAPYVSLQDTELSGWDLYATDFGKDTEHVRVHPLLHWTEIDIWKYIKDRNLPVHPLYFKGYRSLGCYPCTRPIWEPVESIDEIIKRLETTDVPERAGRDSTKEDIMRKLRALGYC